MSKLYFTEEGRVIPSLGEELTSVRWARKQMNLPGTRADAALYILARAHVGTQMPLHVLVNGHRTDPIQASMHGVYAWHRVRVPGDWILSGLNVFEFYADARSMTAWSLGMEPGHAHPMSAVSDDGGETWRAERMGFLCAVRGEYIVRVRLAEGSDSAPPGMVWEKSNHPRVAALRERLPKAVHAETSRMGKVRALASWLSSSWEHTSSGRASLYAPWDAETILDWGQAQVGHNGMRPITMCVHYAVALTSACQALGIPARCAAVTGGINSGNGHFVSEVWFEEWEKWVMVDANADAIFYDGNVPMSLEDIRGAGDDLGSLIRWGKGAAFQRQFPHMVAFIEEKLETGLCFRYRSFWPRADLLSHPEFSPPGHGSTFYCETPFVWDAANRDDLGMFPHFASAEALQAPPEMNI